MGATFIYSKQLFKPICKCMLVFLFLQLVLPQELYSNDRGKQYSRFRIFLHSGELIEGKKGTINDSVFSGIDTSGKSISVPFSDIRSIRVRSGAKIKKYAMAGAAIGAGSTLIATVATISAGYDLTGDDAGLILALGAGMIGAGALVGAMVGSFARDWKEIDINPPTSNYPEGVQPLLVIQIGF